MGSHSAARRALDDRLREKPRRRRHRSRPRRSRGLAISGTAVRTACFAPTRPVPRLSGRLLASMGGTELRNERLAVLVGGDRCASSATSGSAPRARARAGSGSRRSGRRSKASSTQRKAQPDRPVHRGRERPQPRPAGTRQGAASRQGHRGDAGDRQARPAVAERRLPADAAGQRREVRRGRPARGERPDRRASWRWWRRPSARRSPGGPRRRWRWPRSRGVRLGNPNGAAALRRAGKGGAPLRAAIARNADRHAQDLAPVVAGHPLRRRDKPQGDRGRARCPRHAHPPRRPLARLDGDEPARPARELHRVDTRTASMLPALATRRSGAATRRRSRRHVTRDGGCGKDAAGMPCVRVA